MCRGGSSTRTTPAALSPRGCPPRGRTPPGCERPPRRTKHPSAPAAERYRPFSFFRRSRQGVAGGRRGGRARSRTSGGRLRAGAVGPVRPYGAILPPPSARAPSVHEATDGHAVRRPLPLRLPCPPCGVHDHRHNKFKDNDLQNASWKPLRLSSPLSIDCFARC